MVLSQEDKEDVYGTVSIELMRMFDRLSHIYRISDQTEHAELIREIETDIRKCSDFLEMPE